MKFRFKLSNLLLHIATLSMIILSIVLWVFVMTNDQRFSHFIQQPKVEKGKLSQHNFKSLRDLYLPTNTYDYRDHKLYQIYDSKRNLPFEFSKECNNIKVDKADKLTSSRHSYRRLLNSPDYIQLTYSDHITTAVTFNLEQKVRANYAFNRIFLPEKSNAYLYLGNDHQQRLYRLNLKNADFSLFRKYTHHAHDKVPVSLIRLQAGYFPSYNQSFSKNVYSYLVDHSDNSYFVSRLLGTSGVSSKTNHHGRTTYTAGYNSRLQVPKDGRQNDHNFVYTNYEKAKRNTASSKLLDSVYYVHQLGLMEQDLHFFDADENSISYTNFIEGSPVFLNQHDLQIQIEFSGDVVTNRFNSTNLQIPIPVNREKRTVEATPQLLSALSKKGLNRQNIQAIVLGFKAVNDNKRENLLELVPTYYVKALGQWRSADEWQQADVASLLKQSAMARRER